MFWNHPTSGKCLSWYLSNTRELQAKGQQFQEFLSEAQSVDEEELEDQAEDRLGYTLHDFLYREDSQGTWRPY